MAATLSAGDQTGAQRLTRASAARVKAYRQRHPDADLDSLVGRPVLEAAPQEMPAARSGRIVTNAADAGAERVDVWVDGYITSMPWFDDEISAGMLRDALAAAGGRDVRVHLNSGGGDYFEGVAMHTALRDYAGDVYMAVDALAASAASVVMLAGDTVGIGAGAFVMIHDASTFCYGNAADLLSAATMLDSISAEIAGMYAARAGGNPDEWRDAMRTETWYGPDAAVAAKLADERITSAPAADPAQPGDDDGEDDEDMPMPMPPEDAAGARVVALFERILAAVEPTPAPPGPAPPDNRQDEFVRRLMGDNHA